MFKWLLLASNSHQAIGHLSATRKRLNLPLSADDFSSIICLFAFLLLNSDVQMPRTGGRRRRCVKLLFSGSSARIITSADKLNYELKSPQARLTPLISLLSQMNAVALALGLITLGLVAADVSHLNQNYQHQQHNSFQSRTYSKTPNSKRYWWMNTDTPFAQAQHGEQNHFAAGCNGCASRTLNIRHNTQHANTQHDAYRQNPFINAKHSAPASHSTFNHIQSASVSGSPSRGVNNFFSPPQQQQQQNSFASQLSASCSDGNSGCVAPKFCYNGFIDRSAEHKAVRSAVSCFDFFFVVSPRRQRPLRIQLTCAELSLRAVFVC
jgi:hypothetical protein